ncbi:MAG: Two-component hybrid sensor and regulator [Parcubacteria group bacterium GW2011_GWC1_38_17]|nr:MAG: Two-component hybrid sensor and regulator [Parcubacteria group bacterium GW2011_GWE2_37_8]KKQ58831.1 MAG: Two-component hybrid sensor and regulator [Parcubacteria group bacterium GW2011_GWC1_38_17]
MFAKRMVQKVLIIEDEDVLRNVLAKKLEKEGYEVIVAADGEAGMNSIRNENPDMILLDIMLPKKNGYQILEEMHGDEELKKIPVLVISNSGQPVEVRKILELGACDYLVKADFEPQEVIDKMRTCLSSKGL